MKLLNKRLNLFLIGIYLMIGFTPYLNSIDKIATQYLFISIFNIIVFSLIVLNKKIYEDSFLSLFKFRYFFSFIGLIILSSLSYFYSINGTESLVQTVYYLNYFFSLTNVFILSNRNFEYNLKNLPYFILAILIIENIWIYKILIEKFNINTSSRQIGLRGFTGNINITAFAMLFKLPFLFYLLNFSKKGGIKILCSILTISTLFVIFNFGSRGANYASILLIFFIIGYFLKSKKYKFIALSLALYFSAIGINKAIYSGNESYDFFERSSKLNNSSTSARLGYYSDAIKSIFENPILGIGSGNWKIKSIEYDRFSIVDYTIPYHVHNDFLEVTAELGILGFLFLYGIVIFLLAKFLINFFKNRFNNSDNISYFISISIIIFFIDSFFNFPLARPVIFLPILILFIFFCTKNYLLKISFFDYRKVPKLFLGISFILLFTTVNASYLIYNSFSNQQFLNAAVTGKVNDYSNKSVFSISSKFPNIMATTIPLDIVKANLLINNNYLKDTVLGMIDKGLKANPHLGYGEMVKSLYYIKKVELDTAYYFAKKGFYQLPNHTIHFKLLCDFIDYRNDSIELNKAYNFIEEKGVKVRDELKKKFVETSLFINNENKRTSMNIINQLLEEKPEDEEAFVLSTILEVGIKNVEEAYELGIKAEKFFNDDDYKAAAKMFREAYILNPRELSYVENEANSFMQLGEFSKAIEILKEHIEINFPSSGKAEYLLGLNYLNTEEKAKACFNFISSRDKGFPVSEQILSQFCK